MMHPFTPNHISITRSNEMIQTETKDLMELSPLESEYALAIVMPSKKNIYGNWKKKMDVWGLSEN